MEPGLWAAEQRDRQTNKAVADKVQTHITQLLRLHEICCCLNQIVLFAQALAVSFFLPTKEA